MADNEKNVLNLRQVTDVERLTTLKARESWSMFSIMSEFIETTERLSELHPAVTIFGSARIHPDNPYYIQCMELSRRLSDAGFAVISGGGPGIMAAANRGAFEGKSLSVGLNIDLPHEQQPNRWQNITLNFRHFFARKVAFAKYADAFVLFPGGFGTMDEMSEVLTLIQTGKSRRIPVILVGTSFWQGLLDWFRNTMVAHGTLTEADLGLIEIIDGTDQILDAIFNFYEKKHHLGPSEDERQKMLYL
jgi:hypothetical protein